MIDTLILFYIYDFITDRKKFEYILGLFNTKPSIIVSKVTGEEFYCGNIYNFNIKISHNSLTISGSICKFYYGNNQQTLSYDDFIHAIMELKILLNISDLDRSIVRRIDLAENLIVKQKPEAYYDLLTKGGYLKRREDDNGLYYRNTNRTICIYDKVKEEKKHKNTIQDHLIGKNAVRWESRMNRNMEISKRLNVKRATLLDVIMNHDILVQQWRNSFDLIPKDVELNIPQDQFFQSPTEFKNFLAVHGMKNLGGYGKVMNLIYEAKARCVFKYPAQSSNLKTAVKKLTSKVTSSQVPEMLQELEHLMNQAVIKQVN